MQEVRHSYREALRDLEKQALGGLDLVTQALDRALESVSYQDVELAGMVVADDDRIDGRYLEVHQGVLSLLARQAPDRIVYGQDRERGAVVLLGIEVSVSPARVFGKVEVQRRRFILQAGCGRMAREQRKPPRVG